MYSDEITGVVIDIGNQTCRAGYSGEDTPKTLFTSFVGVVPQEKVGDMDLEKVPNDNKGHGKVYYTGDFQAKTRRDHMQMHQSYNKGQYTDFDLFEQLINEIYAKHMEIQPTQYPLLMSEFSMHDKDQRQRVCEIMFEKHQVPAFFMCKAAVLSCFASGRQNALILDSGATTTLATPVHDGYALQKRINGIDILRYDFAGEYVTTKVLNYVQSNLKTDIVPRHYLNVKVEGETKTAERVNFPNTHYSFDEFCKYEIARDIKESCCRIPDKSEGMTAEKAEYELPDGKKVYLDDFRYAVGDCFFNPIDQDQNRELKETDLTNYKGFHHMILESINKCDVDLRKELLANIILTGGNTLLPGFVENMQKKLLDIAPQNAKVKLIAYPHTIERRYSSWIGGSILSSLGSFQSMWIGKAEYDDHGSYIVEKKCP